MQRGDARSALDPDFKFRLVAAAGISLTNDGDCRKQPSELFSVNGWSTLRNLTFACTSSLNDCLLVSLSEAQGPLPKKALATALPKLTLVPTAANA
jgi:hypothetical protein